MSQSGPRGPSVPTKDHYTSTARIEMLYPLGKKGPELDLS